MCVYILKNTKKVYYHELILRAFNNYFFYIFIIYLNFIFLKKMVRNLLSYKNINKVRYYINLINIKNLTQKSPK